MEGKIHILPLRVYYEDTDAAGMVYHANFIKYMERARTDFLRLMGIWLRDWTTREDAIQFVVKSVNIEYMASAFLDDAIRVVSIPKEMKSASMTIDQEVLRGDTLLARAIIRVACLDNKSRPRRLPDEVKKKLAPLKL